MFTSNSILIKPLAQQSIVWFKASNTYVLLAPKTVALLVKIAEGFSKKDLKFWCEKELKISLVETDALLKSVFNLIATLNKPKTTENLSTVISKGVLKYNSTKYYQMGTQVIKVSFETETLAFLIHPKFEHLSTKPKAFDYEFEVYLNNENIVLEVDKSVIGIWAKNEIEYFQGKFSMCLIEKWYQKPETDWMGVFHASAISDGKKCILFTGDSGNGKSTLAALLMAKEYNLLADDFVPIATENRRVYYFPAAISIKENAVKILLPLYSKLDKETLHDFKSLNKKVRYLAPKEFSINQKNQLPCKALVFVKYEENCRHSILKMDKEKAFQQLIPDSWLSPETNNAQQFLDWFATMPCYKLTYSDNALMYKSVSKFFNDEL